MKDCGIVKDLLPLYTEDMASEQSAAFVKEHLETCEDCRKAYEEMKTPIEAEATAPLKSVRRTVKRRGLLIAGLIACLVAALILVALARLTKPIPISASERAFAEATVIPETIPLPAVQTEKAGEPEAPEQTKTPEQHGEDIKADREKELVKDALQVIIVMMNEEQELCEVQYMVQKDGSVSQVDHQGDHDTLPKPFDTIGFTIWVDPNAETEQLEPNETVAYVYSVPKDDTQGEKLQPDAVIAPTPKTLKLIAEKGVKLTQERTGGEVSIGTYTTLWDKWFSKDAKPQETEITLSDVDAVFFEPYNNTEHEVLYARDGYTPEAGFALPRLVMNYYLMIALGGTVLFAAAWLALRRMKKQKASRIFGILFLIAGSFTLAFLAAGFPATTIAPVRELAFVCIIAVLLIGAGMSGQAVFKHE